MANACPSILAFQEALAHERLPACNDIPEDSNHFTQVAIAHGRFNTRRKFSSNAGVVAAEDLTSHGPEVNWDVISTF